MREVEGGIGKGIRKVGVILPKAGLNRPGLKVTEQAMGWSVNLGGVETLSFTRQELGNGAQNIK